MKNRKREYFLRAIKLLNLVLIAVPFVVCWYCYYAQRISSPFYARGNWLMVALFFLLYGSFAQIYDALAVSLHRISELVYSQALATLFADGLIYIVIWLLSKHLPNPLPGLAALSCQALLSVLWCYLMHQWYYRIFPPEKSLVIFDRRHGMENLFGKYGLNKKYDIQATVSAADCVADPRILDGYDTVFLNDVRSSDRNMILKHCINQGIHVYVIPRVGDVIMSGARRMHMFHRPILRVGRYSPPPEYLLCKRLFDILVSATVLILTSPIMLITAIAIKATDGGPVLYKQCRLTRDGKTFRMVKFRSMRVDAEKDGVARLSTGSTDDRITPVGRFIRKCRIDELPQLFNVLHGSMSLVGPRPERPEIAAQYEKEMPEFRLRLQAKAGLTGYAQIYGKYNTAPYNKLQMDLMYIAKPSFIEDLRLILATVKILFLPESTEGIAVNQLTAVDHESGEENTSHSEKTTAK